MPLFNAGLAQVAVGERDIRLSVVGADGATRRYADTQQQGKKAMGNHGYHGSLGEQEVVTIL